MHREPECALHGIGRVAKLRREPAGSEERNPGRVPTQGEALPRKPDVEVQNGGPGEAKRAFEAMMTMKKIDVSAIEAARRG